MTSIEEKINYYKDSLEIFDDDMEKYKFLLDQAKNSKKFPEEYRQDSFLVSGCQAKVWLVPYKKNDKINFYSDSDAFIAKGMITMLCDIYGGQNPSEIVKSDFEFLKTLKLDNLLTPGRRNGVYAMLMKIREHANAHITT